MNPVRWLPIKYRDFYDVPRLFVVESELGILLFDCAFDIHASEYPTRYTVYRLHADTLESATDDWRSLPEKGIPVATVDLEDVKFDPTKRQFVDGDILDHLKF